MLKPNRGFRGMKGVADPERTPPTLSRPYVDGALCWTVGRGDWDLPKGGVEETSEGLAERDGELEDGEGQKSANAQRPGGRWLLLPQRKR